MGAGWVLYPAVVVGGECGGGLAAGNRLDWVEIVQILCSDVGNLK